MFRLSLIAIVAVFLVAANGRAIACTFTPLEWQQRVEQHVGAENVGQRKHMTWNRDLNRNFIDDRIDAKFVPGELVDVVVNLNKCLTPREIQELFSKIGKITYIHKLVSSILLNQVRFEDLKELASLHVVAMVEWQAPVGLGNDVGSRANQSHPSVTFSPNTAADAGFNGTGVTIAVLDTGVDDAHQSFAGKFVAGFDASIYEDTNGNNIDDSCEPAPLGNGVCTDADDEPGDGSTNPPDNHSHGTHVAATALGAGIAGTSCSATDDGSPTNCAGTAPGANLVDIRICPFGCSNADMVEALDWLGINAQKFNIRVATMSVGGISGTNDDGTSAMAQQLNYLTALGVFFAVLHHNASNTGVLPGTQIVDSPQSASFATTVAGTNDRDTVTRTDDINYTQFLRGPRTDFNLVTPNLLALKPDIAAPGENIFSAQNGTVSSFFSQSGTSMATPNLAGAAAVMLHARPDMTPGSLKSLLKQTADTSLNTAQFPAVDPVWDNDLGSGMLDIFQAVNSATASDPGFPNCVGPPSSPGNPCQLTAPLPSWNNSLDIATAASPEVGVANTITTQVVNNGLVPTQILVNFGVYVFAAGNNQFFHIGTQQVTVPAGMTVPVSQPWTPASSDHQCVQVSIDYGPDTDYANNVTQRNLQVAASTYDVRIENPFFKKTRFELRAKSDREHEGWICKIEIESFTLDPFQDCPRTVKVDFHAPDNAKPGEFASCDIGVVATPEEGKEQLIGGVTVQTIVPRPCRLLGIVVDRRGRPIEKAVVKFTPRLAKARGDAETTVTDSDGVFSIRFLPKTSYRIAVDAREVGKGEIVLRPECGIGKFRLEVSKEGLRKRVAVHALPRRR
jgi:subtilisin family serine protease